MKRLLTVCAALVCAVSLMACNERDLPLEWTETLPEGQPATVTASYSRGDVEMTMELPMGWTWEAVEDGGMGTATEGIRFYRTDDAAVEWVLLCWTEGYGICGTGVDSEKLTLSGGQTVTQHTETMTGSVWVNIVFEDAAGSYVAMPAGGGTMDTAVWEACRKEVLDILGTVVIGAADGGDLAPST